MARFEASVEVRSRFDADKVRQRIAAALNQFGEEVGTAADQVVPVDTGTLKNSRYVTPPESDGDVITVSVGYGGVAAPYALAVHENMSPTVHWSTPGTGPKYLENPLKERQGELPDILADAVREALS